jgi:hypothetical protein
MIKFLDWLKKKQQPTQSSSKPVMTPQAKSKEKEDDMGDYWQASSDAVGLSDKRRKQLISNNPKFSDERLKEIEDAWKSKEN